GDALDRHPQLFIDVPEVVADDLVGDRIDLVREVAVQREARVDGQRVAGDVGERRPVVGPAGDRGCVRPIGHLSESFLFAARPTVVTGHSYGGHSTGPLRGI